MKIDIKLLINKLSAKSNESLHDEFVNACYSLGFCPELVHEQLVKDFKNRKFDIGFVLTSVHNKAWILTNEIPEKYDVRGKWSIPRSMKQVMNYKGVYVKSPQSLDIIMFKCGDISLSKNREDDLYRVIYGLSVTNFKDYEMACEEVRSCLEHALTLE